LDGRGVAKQRARALGTWFARDYPEIGFSPFWRSPAMFRDLALLTHYGRPLFFVATAIAFALSIVNFTSDAPQPALSLMLLALYLALISWGVMDLRLAMFAPTIYRAKTSRNEIALTFDDGPDPHSTPIVLDLLRAHDAKATFFVIGSKVAAHPELARSIVQAGHEIAVHSYAHELHYAFLTPRRVQRDIRRCQHAIESATGTLARYFRPPVGQLSPRTGAGIARAEVQTIGWSVRAGDGVRWRERESFLKRVIPKLKPGAIVLLHDAWLRPGSATKGRQQREMPRSGDAHFDDALDAPLGVHLLPEVLRACQDKGQRCVTVSELLRP
jgi:peptidoglycan/xylan/chitin deacetylase (PgdA/CDA1 family)